MGAKIRDLSAFITNYDYGRFADFVEKLSDREGNEDITNLKPIRLTPRQIEVLLLIFQGKSNRDIASELHIIEVTVKAHVGAIFRELNVVNRTQALLAAQKLGFRSTTNN